MRMKKVYTTVLLLCALVLACFLTLRVQSKAQSTTQHKAHYPKWEYYVIPDGALEVLIEKIKKQNKTKDDGSIEAALKAGDPYTNALDKLGEDGWELAAIDIIKSSELGKKDLKVYIFKRGK